MVPQRVGTLGILLASAAAGCARALGRGARAAKEIPAGAAALHPAAGLPGAAEEALDGLWSGSDSVWRNVHHPQRPLGGAPGHVLQTHRGGAGPRLQILGMFDSGTHLLGALLEANVGHEIMRDICPNGDIGAENTWKDDYHCYFWKHETPQQLDRLLDTFERQEAAAGTRRPLVVVALVRSPLAQLAGWAKAPYELEDCVNSWNTDAPGYFKPRAACSLRGDSFAGLTGVWNQYTRAYDNLSSRADVDVRTIVVEYERLVLDPEPVVRKVAEALGLFLETFTSVEVDAKKDGESHGRDRAIRSIESMLYLREFDPGENLGGYGSRRAVCKSLDQRLLRRHNFVLSSGGTRAYTADCE